MSFGPEDYIRLGWKIFPCHGVIRGVCTCGRVDCKAPGKHPRTTNGHNDATSDLQTVRQWWTTWPQSNIGVATGLTSGIWVVDVDPRNGGFDTIEAYEEERGEPLPDTLTASTGGGGRHLFWQYPKDGTRVPSRKPWRPGVDIKSDGGYVILPPGTHISGGRYSWLNMDSGVQPRLGPSDLLLSIRNGAAGGSTTSDLPSTSDILQGVPEGKRDETLFRFACRLRRQMGDQSREAVEILVLAAASKADPPFPEDEALRKVEQAWRQDHNDDPLTTWSYVTPDGGKLEHLTDVGNKNRFLVLHGDDLRYVPQWGWLQWTQIGWQRVGAENVLHAAEQVADVIREEATQITDGNTQAKFARHSLASESAGAINAMVSLAKNDGRVLRVVDDFDRDAYELACRNGIVDLRTGHIREFTREDTVTKNTNVLYDPNARSPEWEEFLKVSTQGDTDLMSYLQLAAGYTLTGDVSAESFFIISGPKASGKSTFVDAILTALGTYGTTTQSETFMYRRGKDAPRDELARFAGMRLVAMSEIREGEYFNESLIKQVTGGDRVVGKFLYKDPFSFQPQFKLWIATNHDPASQDDALLRRIKRIMFPDTIPDHLRKPGLKMLLKDSETGGRAVLAWMVRGAMRFMADGLMQPAQVTMAVADYAAEHDMFTRFLNDCCEAVPDVEVSEKTLYAVYKLWCQTCSEYPARLPQFNQKMKDRKYERTTAKTYPGLRIKPMQLTESGGASWG